jgi:ABC-type branched-subunit amino acid transport system substrate-binding protein
MGTFWRSISGVLALLLVVPAAASGGRERRVPPGKPIVIGLHAPMTGAVPLPSQSLGPASDIYWKWLRHKGMTINGRNVEIVLRNDNGNPQQARQVCREMVKEDGAFILAGVLQNSSGSVQSEECAEVAENAGISYISLGGTTAGVKDLTNHFAISMTFRAQGRLLADHFVEKMKARGRNNGVVSFNTPHNLEATRAFRNRLEDRKADLDVERLIARTAGATEAQAVAAELKAAGVENVFVFTSPTFFIQLLQAANNLSYEPLWSGIGISVTTSDDFVSLVCRNGVSFRGRFFSPLPAFGDRADYDPTFELAMAAIYPTGPKDGVVWQGWSTAKQIAEMLRATGPRLTTRSFISGVEAASDLSTGILPALDFTPRDHFGASQTHVLAPRCSDERWHTGAKPYG